MYYDYKAYYGGGIETREQTPDAQGYTADLNVDARIWPPPDGAWDKDRRKLVMMVGGCATVEGDARPYRVLRLKGEEFDITSLLTFDLTRMRRVPADRVMAIKNTVSACALCVDYNDSTCPLATHARRNW